MAAGQATYSDNVYIREFFRYNISTSTWENITNCDYSYTSRFFSGSALIGGYFYLVYGWNYEINNDVKDIMRVDLDSTEFIWEEVANIYAYARDSFGLAVKNTDIYIFGGYIAESNSVSNELIKFNSSSDEFTQITKSGSFPSARSSPSMHLINTQLYLFAGKSIYLYYNDMWVYDIASDMWSDVIQLGSIPAPRCRHAADSQGDAIVIWGGEGNLGLLSDMYIYNTLTFSWTELSPVSAVGPVAAEGACMVMNMPYIYIFGGLTNGGCLGQLWIYDVILNTYSLLSDSGPKLAYITCQLKSTKFYVLFGQSAAQQSSGAIITFDIVQLRWNTLHSDPGSFESSSQGIQMLIGDFILRIAGEAWDLDAKTQVYLYNPSEILIGSIGECIYLSGFAYYNTSLYSFGGSFASGGLLSLSIPSQLFIEIDVKDICAGGICETLCSPGTFLKGITCQNSPPGYYSEGFGNTIATPCPVGTVSSIEAASSIRQCYPCPEGSFSSTVGSSLCFQCPTGYICRSGSILPLNSALEVYNNSTQPGLYVPPDITSQVFQLEICIGVALGVFLCMVLLWKKLNIKNFDVYIAEHNYLIDKYIILRRTTIGGIFTIIFVSAMIYIIGEAMIIYQFDNIVESKEVVPLVVLQTEAEQFVSDSIEITLNLLTYGDICVITNSSAPSILITLSNINYTSLSYTSVLNKDKTCTIAVHCTSCTINQGATLSITLQEQLSYSTGIIITASSSSSIPGNSSSVTQSLYASSGCMFIGPVASQFSFIMTPSLFVSESSQWPSTQTGYHVFSDSIAIAGSQYMAIDLSVKSRLEIIVVLDTGYYSLYTRRAVKSELMIVFSSLIGSISGIMAIVGRMMILFEGSWKKFKAASMRKNYIRNLKKRKIATASFFKNFRIEEKGSNGRLEK